MKQHQGDIILPAVLLIGMLGGKQRERECAMLELWSTLCTCTQTPTEAFTSPAPPGMMGWKGSESRWMSVMKKIVTPSGKAVQKEGHVIYRSDPMLELFYLERPISSLRLLWPHKQGGGPTQKTFLIAPRSITPLITNTRRHSAGLLNPIPDLWAIC